MVGYNRVGYGMVFQIRCDVRNKPSPYCTTTARVCSSYHTIPEQGGQGHADNGLGLLHSFVVHLHTLLCFSGNDCFENVEERDVQVKKGHGRRTGHIKQRASLFSFSTDQRAPRCYNTPGRFLLDH
eukprot:scaffold3851_cov162-Amphora_coffeaeformis.AAC.8